MLVVCVLNRLATMLHLKSNWVVVALEDVVDARRKWPEPKLILVLIRMFKMNFLEQDEVFRERTYLVCIDKLH